MNNVTLVPVRYFTDADTYHYSIENRPMQDLAANDGLIINALRRQFAGTVVTGDADTAAPDGGILTIVYNAPLTAVRAINLNLATPQDGDIVRVVRQSAASGASTLSVKRGATSLKNLAANQWGMFTYIGSLSLWVETAFGTL